MGIFCSKPTDPVITSHASNFISNIQTQKELDSDTIDDRILWFSFSSKTICSKCVKVCDGNTIDIVANLYDPITGIKQYRKLQCTLSGYTAYCLNASNESSNKLGELAREYLFFLIYNKQIFIQVQQFDKNGQVYVMVYLDAGDVLDEYKSVNIMMLERHGIISNRCPSYQHGADSDRIDIRNAST